MERILKLIPGRASRRLELIHRGYVHLYDPTSTYHVTYRQLVRWGLLHGMEPVHFLDAYHGHRPTRKGLVCFVHEEAYHLILCRKSKLEELPQRAMQAREVEPESAMATFGEEMKAAKAKGFVHDPNWMAMPGQDTKLARYVRSGYLPLEEFQRRHALRYDELIVSGVLRYLEHRDPDKIPDIDVGAKAKTCILISTRWQLILVRPGMEEALLDLINIRIG